MILSSPVTDYCANLLVLDELTGTITFPHRTVQDYLADPQKLPLHLKKYQLSNQEDDMWCGQICLAYAKLQHNSKRVVKSQTQTFSTNVTAPVFQTVMNRVLPHRLWTPSAQCLDRCVRLPVPSAASPRGPMGKSFSMHDYLCRHWLSHNRQIATTGEDFTLFAELCLAHDPDLQPWATGTYCHQSHLLQRLLPYLKASLEGGIWSLTNVMNQQVWENTLQVCVANGEQTSLMIIVTNYLSGHHDSSYQDSSRSWREALSAVFFQSCRLGQDACARFIVGLNLVDPNISFELRLGGAFKFGLHCELPTSKCYSTLSKALELGEIRLMRNLLRLGANPCARGDRLSITNVVKRFGGRYDDAAPFIEVLVSHGWLGRYEEPLFSGASWVGELKCLERAESWPNPRFYRANQYLRLVLQTLARGTDDDHVRALRQQRRFEPAYEHVMNWLKVVPDDILVSFLKYDWLHHEYLTSSELFNIMAMRGTSRGLEAWVVSIRIWMNLESQTGSLGLPDTSSAIGDRSHSSATPEAFAQRRLARLQTHSTGCTIQTALLHGREQTLEFLAWCNAQECASLMLNAKAATGRYKYLIEALNSHGRCAVDKTDTLPWVRLYIATKGDVSRTNELYQELVQARSDANPGLNFPAGYTKVENDLGETWVISRSVIRCLHRWSFRLNRKKGKSCSEADTIYMAMVWRELIEAMRPHPSRRFSFATTSHYLLCLLRNVHPAFDLS